MMFRFFYFLVFFWNVVDLTCVVLAIHFFFMFSQPIASFFSRYCPPFCFLGGGDTDLGRQRHYALYVYHEAGHELLRGDFGPSPVTCMTTIVVV